MALTPDHSRMVGFVSSSAPDETGVEIVDGPALLDGFIAHRHSTVGDDDGYLHFYDSLLADVVVGTTTPKFTVPVHDYTITQMSLRKPILFETAMSIAVTLNQDGTGSFSCDVVIFNGDDS